MQAQVVAALSLPVCATTLGKSDLTEVVTASTRGSFENQQLLLWLMPGNFYIIQSYRASDTYLVKQGAPLLGQRPSDPSSHGGSAHLLWACGAWVTHVLQPQ